MSVNKKIGLSHLNQLLQTAKPDWVTDEMHQKRHAFLQISSLAQEWLNGLMEYLDAEKRLGEINVPALSEEYWRMACLELNRVSINGKQLYVSVLNEAEPDTLAIPAHLYDVYRFDAYVYFYVPYADQMAFLDGEQATIEARPLGYFTPEHFQGLQPQSYAFSELERPLDTYREYYYMLSFKDSHTDWDGFYKRLQAGSSSAIIPENPAPQRVDKMVSRYNKYREYLRSNKVWTSYSPFPDDLSVSDYTLFLTSEACAEAFIRSQRQYNLLDLTQVVSMGAVAHTLFQHVEKDNLVAFRAPERFQEGVQRAAAGGAVHLPVSEEEILAQVDCSHEDINPFDLTFKGHVKSGEGTDITIRHKTGYLPEDAGARYLLWKMPYGVTRSNLIEVLKKLQDNAGQDPKQDIRPELIYAGPQEPATVKNGRIRIKDAQVPLFSDGSKILILIEISRVD